MRGPLIRRSRAEREVVLEAIQSAVEADPAVLFAYVYGSFLTDCPFHDVDVAVYLDPADPRATCSFLPDLASDLESVVHLPMDVRVLNQAPLGFRYHVFRGKLLYSRDESLRVACVERTVGRYLDIEPLRRQALKEAMMG